MTTESTEQTTAPDRGCMSRNASIDLLRIAAMALIVLTHLRWFYLPMEDLPSTEQSIWKAAALFANFHVNVFVIISGYFGLKGIWHPFVKTFSSSYFYIVSLSIAFYFATDCISWRSLIFPVTESPWWFIRTYFLLILLAPLLESAYSNLQGRNKYLPVGVLSVACAYWGFIHHTEGLYNSGTDIITFLNLYAIGQMLRDRSLTARFSRWQWACAFLLLQAGNAAFALMQHTFGIPLSVADYSNPLTILIATTAFIMALKSSYRPSRIITWLQESSIAVYLLTEFPPMRGLLQAICRDTYPGHWACKLMYVPTFIGLVFIACCMADKIRILATSRFVRLWTKH